MKESSDPDRIVALRKITSSGSMAKVEGVKIDITTAGMLLQIFDAMKKEESKASFASLPIGKMIDIGWKLVSKLK